MTLAPLPITPPVTGQIRVAQTPVLSADADFQTVFAALTAALPAAFPVADRARPPPDVPIGDRALAAPDAVGPIEPGAQDGAEIATDAAVEPLSLPDGGVAVSVPFSAADPPDSAATMPDVIVHSGEMPASAPVPQAMPPPLGPEVSRPDRPAIRGEILPAPPSPRFVPLQVMVQPRLQTDSRAAQAGQVTTTVAPVAPAAAFRTMPDARPELDPAKGKLPAPVAVLSHPPAGGQMLLPAPSPRPEPQAAAAPVSRGAGLLAPVIATAEAVVTSAPPVSGRVTAPSVPLPAAGRPVTPVQADPVPAARVDPVPASPPVTAGAVTPPVSSPADAKLTTPAPRAPGRAPAPQAPSPAPLPLRPAPGAEVSGKPRAPHRAQEVTAPAEIGASRAGAPVSPPRPVDRAVATGSAWLPLSAPRPVVAADRPAAARAGTSTTVPPWPDRSGAAGEAAVPPTATMRAAIPVAEALSGEAQIAAPIPVARSDGPAAARPAPVSAEASGAAPPRSALPTAVRQTTGAGAGLVTGAARAAMPAAVTAGVTGAASQMIDPVALTARAPDAAPALRHNRAVVADDGTGGRMRSPDGHPVPPPGPETLAGGVVIRPAVVTSTVGRPTPAPAFATPQVADPPSQPQQPLPTVPVLPDLPDGEQPGRFARPRRPIHDLSPAAVVVPPDIVPARVGDRIQMMPDRMAVPAPGAGRADVSSLMPGPTFTLGPVPAPGPAPTPPVWVAAPSPASGAAQPIAAAPLPNIPVAHHATQPDPVTPGPDPGPRPADMPPLTARPADPVTSPVADPAVSDPRPAAAEPSPARMTGEPATPIPIPAPTLAPMLDPVPAPVPEHAPEHARIVQIGRQLAPVIETAGEGMTEVRLDPAELGRVRLTLQTTEAAVSLVIQAERPETADLMRRNLDGLTAELRALGYADVAIQLTGGGGSSGGGATGHPHVPFAAGLPPEPADPPPAPAPAARPSPRPGSTLDLRL